MTDTLCSRREELSDTIKNVDSLYKDRDFLLHTEYGNVVLEEVVAELWDDKVHPALKKLINILPLLKSSALWHHPRIKNLIVFVSDNLGNNKQLTPKLFVVFLDKLFSRPGIDRDLRFLGWVFGSETNCRAAFS